MAILHAVRTLRRIPAFTVAAILTLAVGIGAIGAMFAIVHGVLLAPLPYDAPERLVSVHLQAADGSTIRQPPALQAVWTRHVRSLDGIGMHRTGSTNLWLGGSEDIADSVVGTWVSASTMELLRARPLLGRTFTPEEELRSGPDAVILAEAEWRSRFRAAPDVIGKVVMVNSVPRTVVGVMPADFAFPLQAAATRVWLPAKRQDDGSVGEFAYTAVARLAPGATLAQAQQELAAVLPRLADEHPRLASGGATATWLADVAPVPVLVPLHDEVTAGIAPTLWPLAAAAALVLLVAWANVANLLLVRADARQGELAVCAALGASRRHAATHFLGEALLLGGIAGVLGLLLAYAAVAALVAFGPTDVPRLASLHSGASAPGFLALVTAASVLVCAAVPAGRAWRANLPQHLREGGRGASGSVARRRLRAGIATLQIALALVVTLGSALLLRTAWSLSQVDPGFDATHVTTLRTQLPYARYDDAASVAFYTRLADAARQLPGVRAAGVTTRIPLGGGAAGEQSVRTERDARTRSLAMQVVDDGYLAAMSIPLLAGEGFRALPSDRGSEVVISRQAAALLFDDPLGMTALGQRVTLGASGEASTIVGIVGDVRDVDLATTPSALIYRPLAPARDAAMERAPGNMALVVRTRDGSDAIAAALRGIVRDIDPTVPTYNLETMDDVVRTSTARLSLVLALMTAAAAVTLLLATIGLYGVMAYMVALRTREFGVRVALGADPRRIARLVAMRGLVLTGCGIAGGFVLYVLAAPLLRVFLFGVTVADPVTLFAVTMALLGTAMVASWLPARRAARVDPSRALRAE